MAKMAKNVKNDENSQKLRVVLQRKKIKWAKPG